MADRRLFILHRDRGSFCSAPQPGACNCFSVFLSAWVFVIETIHVCVCVCVCICIFIYLHVFLERLGLRDLRFEI